MDDDMGDKKSRAYSISRHVATTTTTIKGQHERNASVWVNVILRPSRTARREQKQKEQAICYRRSPTLDNEGTTTADESTV